MEKMMKTIIKELIKKSEDNYKYIKNFVTDYTKDDDEIQEFFKHLNGYLDSEIELKGFEE